MVGQGDNTYARILSSIPLITLVVACLYYGNIYFLILCSIIGALIAYEATVLLLNKNKKIIAFSTSLTIFSITITLSLNVDLLFPLILGIIGLISISLLLLIHRNGYSLSRFITLLILLSVSLLFSISAIWLRDEPFGLAIIIWLCAVVWGTDIGAYFFGRTLKGPRLAPYISPSKTLSGAFGGIFTAIILSIVCGVIGRETNIISSEISFFYFIFAGLGFSIIAQIGDLLESSLKRYVGVKDTGNIIPGHGGVMDRADSLVFSTLCLSLIAVVAGSELIEWLIP
tara:strand:- start:47881 stop:48735 length:855 start_codon:yes stop_codon:yes gene_type:complete